MLTELKVLLAKLEADLETIQWEEINNLLRAQKCLLRIGESCKQLTILKLKWELKTKNDEIYFFKIIKPSFYSHLFYYMDVISVESRRPMGEDKCKRKYLKEELSKLEDHFEKNMQYYQYYRMGSDDLDQKYFTQIKRFDSKLDSYGNPIQCEDDYSSQHDLIFARIMANERLEEYLKCELEKLYIHKANEHLNLNDIEPIQRAYKQLKWTASKASLTELVYSIYASRSINYGNAELKDIADFVQAVFNVDLGNIYRTYSEMRIRSNQAKFLDELKSSLIKKMEDDNEKAA